MTMSTVPVREPLDGRGLLLRRHEPREQPDLERERREALAERLVVLGGEHGRRHEHGDLPAVLGRLERRPQRHLGLAVADVADHEAVHRPDPLHVGLDLGAARSWSTVSSYGNDASISACHGVSAAKAWPCAEARAA